MVVIKSVLPELRELVGDLAEDLLARSTSDATINVGLKEAFQQIEKGGRTAQAFEVWREDYLDQVAVAWVLGCVFVRFMEDNGLIEECWLAGESDRRKLAEDTHELFFREHAHDTDREYFQHVFKEVGQIPAAKDLFAEGKTPLWAVAPSGDAAMKLLKFWREREADTGSLRRSFQVEGGDTRFLGDLYQELSERAKKKFALLQTPVFVEEFILDRTLTPALTEFGLEKIRMIDPTCGSGHFLLGGFTRLFALWSKPDYTTGNSVKDAQMALDGVWGVDLNPFAVAIARFRLIVAAMQACGIERLKQSPGWKIHLASGDSLLFGRKPIVGGERVGIAQQLTLFEVPPIFAVEDQSTLQEILGKGYHVVVGNPPYIIVRDRVQSAAYRQLYSTCHQKYSLGVPFTQRFWELALQTGESEPAEIGYVGMITANSFMKREFGTKLIEEFFPRVDLTHVIDTSGAYIPGHGTPTVILLGRARRPVGDSVRAVLGIKGEPLTPDDPSQGMVWQSILHQVDRANFQDEFTSTADVPRSAFNSHPWNIGGGGAAELQDQLEDAAKSRLREFLTSIGPASFPGIDDAFVMEQPSLVRQKIEQEYLKPFIAGESVRDWRIEETEWALAPYDAKHNLITLEPHSAWGKHLWSVRMALENVVSFGGKTRKEMGDNWWGWYRWIPERYSRSSIIFPFVASHNHFAINRAERVFNRSVPLVVLSSDVTDDDQLALLGMLNSSTTCFWMKQVSQQKQLTGGDGVRVTSRAQVPYEFAGTQLENLPIPASFVSGPLRERLLRLTTVIDRLAGEITLLMAANAICEGLPQAEGSIQRVFDGFLERRSFLRSQMVFLQEEVDFTTYVLFGLADEALLCGTWDWPVKLDAGMRPFEILQQRNLDGFPVLKNIPPEWPDGLRSLWQRRLEAIRHSKDLLLIEDDHYKRRWIGRQGLFNHTARQNELDLACKEWLLNRLETPKYRNEDKHHTELTTTGEMADIASGDADFLQVAALYRGRPDFDVAALVGELVAPEAVPLLTALRYKPSGLRKRELWERIWDFQRKQDIGKELGNIPAPPKYVITDFLKGDYWRLRGKLDIPKERWVSFPFCSTESDSSLVVGWAGWNHLEQATAIIAFYDARKREGWDAKRLTPLLAGLDQLLPWIHQWHPEIDPEFGETAGQSFQTLLAHDAHELGLTIEDIRNWTPPATTRRNRRTRN